MGFLPNTCGIPGEWVCVGNADHEVAHDTDNTFTRHLVFGSFIAPRVGIDMELQESIEIESCRIFSPKREGADYGLGTQRTAFFPGRAVAHDFGFRRSCHDRCKRYTSGNLTLNEISFGLLC